LSISCCRKVARAIYPSGSAAGSNKIVVNSGSVVIAAAAYANLNEILKPSSGFQNSA
jgi:hypothetical protein